MTLQKLHFTAVLLSFHWKICKLNKYFIRGKCYNCLALFLAGLLVFLKISTIYAIVQLPVYFTIQFLLTILFNRLCYQIVNSVLISLSITKILSLKVAIFHAYRGGLPSSTFAPSDLIELYSYTSLCTQQVFTSLLQNFVIVTSKKCIQIWLSVYFYCCFSPLYSCNNGFYFFMLTYFLSYKMLIIIINKSSQANFLS